MANRKMGRDTGGFRQEIKDYIRNNLRESGAIAIGFSRAGSIDESVAKQYEEWINEGCHGEMEYLRRHIPLRRHTDNVQPETKTVISLAFSFVPQSWRDESLPYISAYAYGEDYHKVIKKRLKLLVNSLKKKLGGNWRICVDSAPLAERYWAMRSGIGMLGINGSIITRKAGSLSFLAEVLTTIDIEPDKSSMLVCCRCGLCVKSCPAKALKGNGLVDARKCINYLTIEKKSDLSPDEKLLLKNATPAGIRYGCDICLKVCPHNKGLDPTEIKEFKGFI